MSFTSLKPISYHNNHDNHDDDNCQKSNNHKTTNQPVSNSVDLKSSSALQKVEHKNEVMADIANESGTNNFMDNTNRNQVSIAVCIDFFIIIFF
ncbi:unnamed protein product [Trichobilharzia regenti]|nr:unnamed protein product [Trichobilharzia regenti]